MKEGGIIIELKTLYAFTSGLFQIVADSRKSYIGQVDIRDYFIPGGHKPVDSLLVERIIKILKELLILKNNEKTKINMYKDINEKLAIFNEKGIKRVDVISGPSEINSDSNLNHILGPKKHEMLQTCKSTIPYIYRKTFLNETSEELHCASCSPFNFG